MATTTADEADSEADCAYSAMERSRGVDDRGAYEGVGEMKSWIGWMSASGGWLFGVSASMSPPDTGWARAALIMLVITVGISLWEFISND